jgi:hypothetical protein
MPNAAMIEVLDTMIANEQSRELSECVEELRSNENEFAASLVSYADDFSAEVRERVWDMIRRHPETHSTILSLLRTVITWIEKERAELKSRNVPKSAPELKELDELETLVRRMGRDILCMTGRRKNERRDKRPPLEVADISELFKGSQAVESQPVDDFVSGDPLDELYRQAVETAKEWEWPIPSHAEFAEQYKQEIEKLRHQ